MDIHEYELLFLAEESHWWFRAKKLILRTVLPKQSPTMNILDAGAGTGGTSKFLEHWGKVTRIEASPTAVKFLKKRHLSYIQHDLNTYKFPQNSYDLVTCLDVLYHLEIKDDQKLIKKFYDTLKPGGLLVITDCAIPQLMSRHDNRNHARVRYVLSDMINKVSSAGFKVEKASYLYFLVFPLTLLSRVFEKFSDRSDVLVPPRFINSLLWYVCWCESYLLRKWSLPIGSSLLVVARKPQLYSGD